MKISKPQIAGILLALYGVIYLTILVIPDEWLKIDSILEFYEYDAVTATLMLLRFVVGPLIALIAGVLTFLTRLKGLYSHINAILVTAASLAIAFTLVYIFISAGHEQGSVFGELIGYPEEIVSFWILVRLALLLAIAALVISTLELRKQPHASPY